MTEPLRFQFDLACSPQHAFEIWTARTSQWWPADHSVSGEAGLAVTIEPHPGGRIFERTRAGIEHDWGTVMTWEPPHRFVYRWHLSQPRQDATEVEITFRSEGSGTRVTIVHRGWDRIAVGADGLRDRNVTGWATLLPHYQEAVASSAG